MERKLMLAIATGILVATTAYTTVKAIRKIAECKKNKTELNKYMVDDVTETETIDNAEENTKNEPIEEIKEEVSEKIEEVKEDFPEKIEEINENVSEKIDVLKEKAPEKIEEVKEDISEAIEEIKDL